MFKEIYFLFLIINILGGYLEKKKVLPVDKCKQVVIVFQFRSYFRAMLS